MPSPSATFTYVNSDCTHRVRIQSDGYGDDSDLWEYVCEVYEGPEDHHKAKAVRHDDFWRETDSSGHFFTSDIATNGMVKMVLEPYKSILLDAIAKRQEKEKGSSGEERSSIKVSGFITQTLHIEAPMWFKDEEFLAVINDPTNGIARWHTPGEAPGEYSDVFVFLDPSLNGEGSESNEIPEHIWATIVEQCQQTFRDHPPSESAVMVRITNFSG